MENIIEKIKELKVKDVMDKEYVISSPNSLLRDVSREITNANASESIIVNSEGKVVGIITLRDIVSAIGKGISPTEKIENIMTKNIIVAKADDPLENALLKMAKYNISRLPILNNKQEIIGILGEKKLLKVFPALYELLDEGNNLVTDKKEEEVQTKEGICENCEQYSDELIYADGKWLCKNCYEEIYSH